MMRMKNISRSIFLMVSLLNSSVLRAAAANVSDNVLRIDQFYINLSDQKNREVCHVISSVVKDLRETPEWYIDMGGSLAIASDSQRERPTFVDSMKEGFSIAKEKIESLECSDLCRGRILALVDGVKEDIILTYSPLAERANSLREEFSRIRWTEYGQEGSVMLSSCSKSVMPDDVDRAENLLREADLLRLEYEKIKIFRVFSHTIGMSINDVLMFVAGTTRAKSEDKIVLLNPDVAALCEAYACPTAEVALRASLELMAAPYLLRKISGPYKLSTQGVSQVMISKDDILKDLAARASMPYTAQPALPAVVPAKRYVRMFTEADEALALTIREARRHIQTSLEKNGKTPAGWGGAEVIMDYGTEMEAGKTSITKDMRDGVENLLRSQMERRGIVEKLGQSSSETIRMLTEWVKSLSPFQGMIETEGKKILRVLSKMDASLSKDSMNNTNALFVNSLCRLRAVYEFYKEWVDSEERKRFTDELNSIVFQSLDHVCSHYNEYSLDGLRCQTGARGRAFIVGLDLLSFFMEKHPCLEVAN